MQTNAETQIEPRVPETPPANLPAARPAARVPAIVEGGGLLQALATAASDPATDIEKMERLYAMHERECARQAEAQFNDAMARAQAKMLPVATNARNDQTNSKYAKLSAIVRAITPIYTAEGLSVSYDTEALDKALRTIAVVSHAAGHTRKFHMDLPLDNVGAKGNVNKTAVHATGSTNSYARRYLLCMIFNVATEDDDDANASGAGNPAGGEYDEHLEMWVHPALKNANTVQELSAAMNKLPKDDKPKFKPYFDHCREELAGD